MPNVQRIAVSSNAEAARIVAECSDQENCGAAIASSAAADLYDLKVTVDSIEDEPDNTTRFLIIGRKPVPASGKDKTSLMVSAKNQSGALVSLLQPFAEQDISMTRIESRPSRRGTWEYVFFFDIEGHEDDEAVQKALSMIENEAAVLKVLGSYPKAVL